ncbi:Putative acetyl-CoA C-acetyltransferase vraB [Staphylococcus devriesei]|nr:Putative acetyl-CoA C-acetyltransferase vraB [Staphylococcus devriesei]
MREAVVVWAKRTPFGKYGGTLKHLEPEALLLPLFQKIKKEYPAIMNQIDDVILLVMVGILRVRRCWKRVWVMQSLE